MAGRRDGGDRDPAQPVFAWVLARGEASCDSGHPAPLNVDEKLGALGMRLTGAELARMDALPPASATARARVQAIDR